MSETPNVDRLIDYLRPLNPSRVVLGMPAGQLLGDLLVMRERASQAWRDAVHEAITRSPTLIVTTAEMDNMRRTIEGGR